MAVFRDLQSWLKTHLMPGSADGNRRPDGGTSCYRPMQRKSRDEERLARNKAAEYAAEQQPIPYAHTGFTDMNPPAGGGYPQAGMNADPYGYGAAQAAQQEYRAAFAAGQENREGGNISYMPGVYTPDAGSSFTHVEHIMAMTSLKSCYEAIECMKNGETLIITMDAIGQDSESIRCQDMLAGAAFTLGCTVRMSQAGSVVVIAPAGVKILPEVRRRAWADPMAMPYGMPANRPPQEQPPVRERRSSQNAVGWEQASGEAYRSYNPYTGNVPAAAGDYSGYGGYGY